MKEITHIELKGNKLIISDTTILLVNERMGDNNANCAIVYQKGDKVSFGGVWIEDMRGNIVRKLKKNEIEERSYITNSSMYSDLNIKTFEMKHNQYPYKLMYSYQIIRNKYNSIAPLDFACYRIPVENGELIINHPIDKTIKSEFENIKSYSCDTTLNMVTHRWKNLLKTHRGNVADINLLLIGLLQEAGLTANPVILSTRNNDSIDKAYPFMHYFNYVIAEIIVSGSKSYIDATEPMLAYNSVPTRCTNIEGLVLKPKAEEWTIIRQKDLDYSQKNFKLNINPTNNKIDVKAEYTSIGNSGFRYRTAYLDDKEKLSKFLKKDENIDVVNDISIKRNESLAKPFSFEFEFKSSYEKSSNKIFVSPFCGLEPKDNPFKQSNRTLPVDLIYLISRKYESEFKIPEGYEIESIPKNSNLDGVAITMNYYVEKEGSAIKISTNYAFKQNIYPASNYEDLKNDFSKMLSKYSEMIVLVKKEN